jgi:hypothetical protein
MRLATRAFFLLAKLFGRISNQFHCCAAATQSMADIKEGFRTAWQHFNVADWQIASGLDPWQEDLVNRFV